ncbi:GPW/gp25 family protein [Accumulibacter sp.]|uniref:GPW/gp25 family protein n=1 Tax=Accumulibacter sp. TaxID=2053492 RepID=UPI001A60C75B|nr:GPW/gp25 family protein [Accumulibacter sp.]MBL8375162.1 GPW/gp25 family protein [Accumulibacter sp.]
MSSDSSFLGTGWSFPPGFAAAGSDVRMVSAAEDIEQSLAILLTTRRGERVMQEDFGCDLSEFQFAEVSQGLIGRIRRFIADGLLHHEPRINLSDVDVSLSGAQEGLLLITIDYTVRATNSRYNMVYPFYLNEATARRG